MMARYMQVVWLYIVGILVILFGLYMNFSANSGPISFIVMLIGLAISAVGAAHGRRMRMEGQFDVEDMMRNKGVVEEKPQAEDFEKLPPQEQPEEVPEGEPQEEELSPEGPPQGSRISGLMGMFRRKGPPEPLSEEDIFNIEMQDIREGRIVPTEADVIELVCPKCGSHNESQNLFCFSCGNRLRRLTEGEKESGKINLKIEPGAIGIVEDQRVAKVVICPKCNVANKTGDKFCWNCGKKIKSDSETSRKELEVLIEQTASLKPKKAVKPKSEKRKNEPDFDDIFGKKKTRKAKNRKK